MIAGVTAFLPTLARIWYYVRDHTNGADMLPDWPRVLSKISFDVEDSCASPPVLGTNRFASLFIPLLSEDWTSQHFQESVLSSVSSLSLVHGFQVMRMISCAWSVYVLSTQFFTEICIAEEKFWRRYLYAKFFKMLTSQHHAMNANLPHFRLTKASNIWVWLELRNRRETLKAEKYQTTDASANFLTILTLFCVALFAIRLISCSDFGNDTYFQVNQCLNGVEDVIFCVWLLGLLIFTSRLSGLLNRTVAKYNPNKLLSIELLNLRMLLSEKRNLSTVQIEEYKSAIDIIRAVQEMVRQMEPDTKKKKSRHILLQPAVYNLLRIILLSAVGTLSSSIFGFKVRLWKL